MPRWLPCGCDPNGPEYHCNDCGLRYPDHADGCRWKDHAADNHGARIAPDRHAHTHSEAVQWASSCPACQAQPAFDMRPKQPSVDGAWRHGRAVVHRWVRHAGGQTHAYMFRTVGAIGVLELEDIEQLLTSAGWSKVSSDPEVETSQPADDATVPATDADAPPTS